MPQDSGALRRLAVSHGVQPSYLDAERRLRTSPNEAIEATLGALLGRTVRDPAIEGRKQEAVRRAKLLEPVCVVWRPGDNAVDVRLLASSRTVDCTIEGKDGHVRGWKVAADDLAPRSEAGLARLRLPDLEPGYYRLHTKVGRRAASSLVICAPVRAYRDASRPRDWGAFLPLYALRSARSWGAGDFTDLRDLTRWVESLGGGAVATLPMLAQFYEQDLFETSPYSPASRLMWNELYIDIDRVPQRSYDVRSRRLRGSLDFRKTLEALQAEPLVDYRGLAQAKRQVLALHAQTRLRPENLEPAFANFKREWPEVSNYARFRAQTEGHGPWPGWRDETPDFDPAVQRYHEYVQWVADGQLREIAEGSGGGLYLDLPLGVNAAAFDTWRWPESFVPGLSAGAPPDLFFTRGQNWGFPPLHPASNREQGYEYVIAFVRHHMRYASRLRIDHVMGLHRLFMIPAGFEARDGVYVRYPAEELYAIFCLESHRHRTEVVGENLGTVPGYVNRAMRRHGFSGMHVLPFQIDVNAGKVRMPHRSDVASLNTHDLPPFTSWWSGGDIADREAIGQISAQDAVEERAVRKAERDTVIRFLNERGLLSGQAALSREGVCRALLRFLGDSPARLVLANLEDLWGETEPQNIPGTSSERPNWRRKARLSLEQMQASADVALGLRGLDEARRGIHPA